METTEKNKQYAMEPENEFQEIYDIVPLPSDGLLYPNKKDKIKVAYMTARCENVLTSPNLIKSGAAFDKLLEMCIKDPDIKPENLLVGDRNAIMLFLRCTGYGEKYRVKVTDPNTGEEFEAEIDLSKLKSKGVGDTPDENMEFSFILPTTKKKIKFKLLTSGDEQRILKTIEALSKLSKNNISPLLTTRLSTMVTQIEEKRDKIYIQQFIENMPARDSLALRKKIYDTEPGVDFTQEFTSPSGNVFEQQIPLGTDFFFPSS